MFYAIHQTLGVDGNHTGTYWVSFGQDPEAFNLGRSDREFGSVQAAQAHYSDGLVSPVVWRQPDPEAGPDILAVGTDGPFYVVTREYVGPDRDDPAATEPLAYILTSPGRTNQSGEERTEGWLGTTNDVCGTAHGEFNTLGQARDKCRELGCYVSPISERDLETKAWWDATEVWTTPARVAAHYQAAEWYQQVTAADLGITAATSDAELEAIIEHEGAEVSQQAPEPGQPVMVHGLAEYLRRLRDDLPLPLLVDIVILAPADRFRSWPWMQSQHGDSLRWLADAQVEFGSEDDTFVQVNDTTYLHPDGVLFFPSQGEPSFTTDAALDDLVRDMLRSGAIDWMGSAAPDEAPAA